MKAVVYGTYGSPDVLEVTDIARPVADDDQVLIRVRAASVNPADWHFMRGLPYLVRVINGLRKPRKATVLAGDLAGQVDAVGKNVTRFRPGDEVFGRTRAGHRPDRRDVVAAGGCAEYQRLRPFLAEWNRRDLHLVKDLIEAGKITPVIDRIYPLSDVPETIRYLETGHARGKIVITVSGASQMTPDRPGLKGRS